MLFRGSDDLPMTSGKISYSGCWQDFKTIVEHVNREYVRSNDQGVRFYAYGCSMGANILGLYMRKEGERARQMLDGAIMYGTPWSTSKGSKFFYETANMY